MRSFTLQIGPVCGTNLFPVVLVRIAHSNFIRNSIGGLSFWEFHLIVLWFEFCLLRNVLNGAFWWQSDWPVHQLWPPSGGEQRTELDVVFFHGLQFTANDTNDAWSSTWTQRGHDGVCWPQEWLPFDLEGAVRVFSVSYNTHVATSPHDHVSEIAHNLFQTLMNPRYEVTSLSL